MRDAYALQGMKALITGGKRRIGRGVALALAEAGADVAINDLVLAEDAEMTQEMLRGMGRETAFFGADISDSDQVNRMFDGFLERFERIDILVNNPYGGRYESIRVNAADPFIERVGYVDVSSGVYVKTCGPPQAKLGLRCWTTIT